MGSLVYAFNSYLIDQFFKIEEQHVTNNAIRAKNFIKSELKGIKAKLMDWANWDDTYQFINNLNSEYIESNISYDTMNSLRLDYMFYFNKKGNIVFDVYTDHDNKKAKYSNKKIEEHLKNNKEILKFDDPENDYRQGIIQLGKNHLGLLYAVKPILKSDYLGPANGYLLFGREIDDNFIKNIIENVRVKVNLFKVNNKGHKSSLDFTSPANSEFDKPIITPKNDRVIYSYTKINTDSSAQGLILQTEQKREIYMQGKKTRDTLIFVLFLTGILISGVGLFILQRFLINRLENINLKLSEAEKKDELSVYINDHAKDEIGKISETVNHLFKSLKEDRKKLIELQKTSTVCK